MVSFLEGSLAETIHSAMKDTVAYDVTLIQVADGGAETNVAAKGWVEDYGDFARFQGMVEQGDRKVILLQQSIPGTTPQRRDRVTVRGETFTIANVGQDPAQATWDLHGQPWQA